MYIYIYIYIYMCVCVCNPYVVNFMCGIILFYSIKLHLRVIPLHDCRVYERSRGRLIGEWNN